jgi:hypothetical protein
MGLVRHLDLKDMPEIYIFCQHAEIAEARARCLNISNIEPWVGG